jgi:DNA-3-methyladenine glycosylase II
LASGNGDEGAPGPSPGVKSAAQTSRRHAARRAGEPINRLVAATCTGTMLRPARLRSQRNPTPIDPARRSAPAIALGRMPPVALATAIEAVASADPVLARLVSLVGPIRYRPRNLDGRFGALVRAIVFQQLAGHAANAIFQRVRALVDGPLTPEALLAVPDDALKGAGLSKAKLASLRDLSAKVMDGTVVLGGASRISDEETIARLVTVRGIGRWTAEMYLMFELRRLDVWPVDDLGVRQGYALAWSLDGPPSPGELQPLGDRFRPYRSVVARYCWEAVALAREGTDPALR